MNQQLLSLLTDLCDQIEAEAMKLDPHIEAQWWLQYWLLCIVDEIQKLMDALIDSQPPPDPDESADHPPRSDDDNRNEIAECAYAEYSALAGDLLANGADPDFQPVSQTVCSGADRVGRATRMLKQIRDSGLKYGTPDANHIDCSGMVNRLLESEGFDHPITTDTIRRSPWYQPVTDPQPGDIMLEPPNRTHAHGHMGIYIGVDARGNPIGASMNVHGPRVSPFGPGGWFLHEPVQYYRPKEDAHLNAAAPPAEFTACAVQLPIAKFTVPSQHPILSEEFGLGSFVVAVTDESFEWGRKAGFLRSGEFFRVPLTAIRSAKATGCAFFQNKQLEVVFVNGHTFQFPLKRNSEFAYLIRLALNRR